MSAELIVTIALGAPTTIIAVAVWVSSRTDKQAAAVRQTFTDLAAPIITRLDGFEGRLEQLEDDPPRPGRRRE